MSETASAPDTSLIAQTLLVSSKVEKRLSQRLQPRAGSVRDGEEGTFTPYSSLL